MNVLDHFSVPYKGLGNGIHHLNFNVDSAFFKEFEESHIDNGNFDVDVELDKRQDHSILLFSIKGKTKTSCDRCLSKIQLPIVGSFELHIKAGENEGSNDEIMFIHPDTSIINLAQVVYEFILLSIPIIKIYDCEDDTDPPCDFDVLDKLDEREEESDDKQGNVWDTLNDLDL
jgi:uncharacterized metal-binding protein YceD (DUF177 family)